MSSRFSECRDRPPERGPDRRSEPAAIDDMARDDALLEALRKKVEEALLDGRMDTAQAVRMYVEMSRICQRRRETLLPALAEARDARALVEAVMEAAVERFGMAGAMRFIAAARERFERKTAAPRVREPGESHRDAGKALGGDGTGSQEKSESEAVGACVSEKEAGPGAMSGTEAGPSGEGGGNAAGNDAADGAGDPAGKQADS